jgi:hypothetical protein
LAAVETEANDAHASAVDEDELPKELRRGDRRFLRRVILVMGVVMLGSVWAFSAFGRAEIGGCVARGFDDLTAH